MNFINRFLVLVGAIAVGLIGVYGLLLVSGAVDPEYLDLHKYFPQTETIAAHRGITLWIDVGISVALVILGSVLLAAQFAFIKRRSPSATVLLRDDEEGRVRISVESIRELAERTTFGVRSVRAAKSSVRIKSGGLRLACDVTLHMAADLPAVTAQIQDNVHEVVERLTGLNVIDVSIRARYGKERDEPVLAK